jgi:hypothetical protein
MNRILPLLTLTALFVINSGFSQTRRQNKYQILYGHVSQIITAMYSVRNIDGVERVDTSARDTDFYNKDGDITEDHAWRINFGRISFDKIIYHYRYNDTGKKTELSYTMFGNKSIEKYDDEGRIIELDYQNIIRGPVRKIYKYNGNTAEVTDYNYRDSVIQKSVSEFDEKYKLFDSPSDLGYTCSYSKLDKQGNWCKMTTYYQSNGNSVITGRQIIYYQ